KNALKNQGLNFGAKVLTFARLGIPVIDLTPQPLRREQMASVNDLRKHVLDDAVELMETLGMVDPLARRSDLPTPALRFLRRVLAKYATLVFTRLHTKAGRGPTGITASIDGVLEAAKQSPSFNPAEIVTFQDRREKLLDEMPAYGVSLEQLNLFRNAELAHSLHPHQPIQPFAMHVLHTFGDKTYELVRDVESALIKCGAPDIQTLPTDKYDEWFAHAQALWQL
ncbi:MAG: hypothetical protein ACLPOA_11665, partial [Methylocella sp.]